jgi:hypothetical protein
MVPATGNRQAIIKTQLYSELDPAEDTDGMPQIVYRARSETQRTHFAKFKIGAHQVFIVCRILCITEKSRKSMVKVGPYS